MTEDDWQGQLFFNIDGARALHNHLEYAIKMWPGSPARPPEEQEMLHHLRDQLFAMRMEYTLSHSDLE